MKLTLPNTVFNTTVEIEPDNDVVTLKQESVGKSGSPDWVELQIQDVKVLLPILQQILEDNPDDC